MKKQRPDQSRDDESLGIEGFFELSTDLLSVSDAQGRYVRLSRSWERLLGHSLHELMARPYMDFVHPDDRAQTAQILAGLLDGREIVDFVNRYRTHDGHYRYLSWRANPSGPNGLIYAVARDVTDAMNSTRRLAEERARLRAIMDTMPDLMFLKNRDLGYVGCNRPFETFTGHPAHDIVGEDDFDLFPPEVALTFRENDLAMLESGLPRRNEEWVTYPDGTRRLLDTLKVPFADADGTPAGVLGISRDITEQARLRGELDFLGSLVDRNRDAIYCADPERGFALVYVNEAASTLLGRPASELLKSTLLDLFPNLCSDHLTGFLGTGMSSSSNTVVTTQAACRQGPVPVEITAGPVPHMGSVYLAGTIRDITRRAGIERRLREREALYRASVEASVDGFWLVDLRGRLLDVNTAYARMCGYDVAQLLTMSIADIEAVESPDDVFTRMARIIASGGMTFETRHRRKDGSIFDVEVTTIYSDVEGGRCFAYLREVRTRRRAEALLKARLRLTETARSGDVDRVMTEALDAAERLTGSTIGYFHFVDPDQNTLSLQAWSTNTLANMCTAEGKGQHYPVSEAGIWADCLRQGQPVIVNDYAKAHSRRGMPDGHAPISRLLSMPVPGATGFEAVIGVGNKAEDYCADDIEATHELALIAMDVVNAIRTEHKQLALREAMAAEAKQWTAALDSFDGGIAILDKDRKLVRANSAFFAMTRSSPELRRGKVIDCLEDVMAPIDDCPLCDHLDWQNPSVIVLEANSPGNPSGRPVELRISPVLEEGGTAASYLLSLYDLTRAREQERGLQRIVAELTRANAELERFTQITAHDLQEPTRRQVLFAQLIQRKLENILDDDTKSFLNHIIDGALRMRDLVRDLHDYTESGLSAHPTELVDLDKLFDDVRIALYDEIEHSRAAIRSDQLGRVLGARPRLQLAVQNILANALKFRHPDRRPEIRVSAQSDGPWVTLSFADNGIGIPADQREDVFTLFRHLHQRGQMPGTGLGLAQCRKVVDDLGGKIWIEANQPHGTVVKIRLPAHL